MWRRREEGPALTERLVILDRDTPQCEILPVLDVDELRLLARGVDGDVAVPLKDLRLKISSEGRVYVLMATEDYIQETAHLAMVERSVVLRNAVNYQKPGAVDRPPGLLMRLLPWVAAATFMIFWIAKK